MVGRHAHQPQDREAAPQAPQGNRGHGRGWQHRRLRETGASLHPPRKTTSRKEPRRHPPHGQYAGRNVCGGYQARAQRHRRSPQTAHPDRGAGGHQLRSRAGGLPHPHQ